jgi:ABC-type glutathione transport system ATPase component
MRYVVLPRVMRKMLAPFLNRFVFLIKDSALVAYIGVLDVMHRGDIVTVQSARPLEAYTPVAFMYFVLCLAASKIVRVIEVRYAVPEWGILSLREICKSYDGHVVLDRVSLDVARGEVVVVIGPSGSGKTTLLRCVNLLAPIDHGTITIAGEILSDVRDGQVAVQLKGRELSEHRAEIGFVFQQFNLFPRRPQRKSRFVSRASLRRPTAARRDLARARDETAAHALRRSDVGARSWTHRRSARGHAAP